MNNADLWNHNPSRALQGEARDTASNRILLFMARMSLEIYGPAETEVALREVYNLTPSQIHLLMQQLNAANN